jgi:hypothetical protein
VHIEEIDGWQGAGSRAVGQRESSMMRLDAVSIPFHVIDGETTCYVKDILWSLSTASSKANLLCQDGVFTVFART